MEVCRGSRKYPHDEIVYDIECPCCILIEKNITLEEVIRILENEIEKLNQEE